MIEQYDCVPGAIVTLDRPWHPGAPSPQLRHNVESGEMMPGLEYESWPGFTHGIVAFTENRGKSVFLYLYDPETETVYTDRRRNIPVRVQYNVDELTLYRKANDFD